MMHNVSKKSGQLNVKVTPEQEAFIAELEKHRITGPELVRGLLDAAADFYAEHGWFSFPLTITPEKFQEIAAKAKANCPISRLLKAEISLTATLV